MGVAQYLANSVPTFLKAMQARTHRDRTAFLEVVWQHHARASGIAPVADGLGISVTSRIQLVPQLFCKAIRCTARDSITQMAGFTRLAGIKSVVALDGDHSLEYLAELKRHTGLSVYAVFHQPSKSLERIVEPYSEAILDGCICVSKSIVPVVERLAPAGRTRYIPHGVDTDFFVPSQRSPGSPLVLFVGMHRRNFRIARSVFSRLASTLPSARLVYVGGAEGKAMLKGTPVECRTGISDEELRLLYQSATVLFLPLEDATANNSLLEGMACGCPIVVTNVGGVGEYTNERCAILCRENCEDSHFHGVMTYIESNARREEASATARARAEVFSWPRIRTEYELFLEASQV